MSRGRTRGEGEKVESSARESQSALAIRPALPAPTRPVPLLKLCLTSGQSRPLARLHVPTTFSLPTISVLLSIICVKPDAKPPVLGLVPGAAGGLALIRLRVLIPGSEMLTPPATGIDARGWSGDGRSA